MMSHAAGVACSLWISTAILGCSRSAVELGFWFEPVSYSSPRLGDPISSAELATIESIARAEIATAFGRFDLTLSNNRQARYSVRVVPKVKDERLQRGGDVAGASRAMNGLGGSGAVSFQYLANGAMVFCPETASRADMTAAIGRAIGRVAIHEFIHQLLPKFDLHSSRDIHSYEGNSPALVEGYFTDLHWGIAEPVLDKRVGRR